MPFLENVTRGRGIPRERLEEVGEHYFRFGGRSPINDQNRAFLAAIREDLAGAGIDLPVYWGNRNWRPLPHRRAPGRCATTGSPGPPASSPRRTRRTPAAGSTARTSPRPPPRSRAPRGSTGCGTTSTTPASWSPYVDATLTALADLPDARPRRRAPGLRHPLDARVDERAQRPVGRGLRRPAPQRGGRDHRPGPPGDRPPAPAAPRLLLAVRPAATSPWLEPDVNDHLETLAKAGTSGVVIVPIGFVSDHMEVVYDLDTEALAHRQPARPPGDPGRDAGDRPALRRRGPRPAARAGRRRARRAADPARPSAACRDARPVPGRLLREPARAAADDRRCGRDRPRTATDLRDLALRVAREAAALVRDRRAHPVEVADTKSSVVDVVTEADRASEALIRVPARRRPGRTTRSSARRAATTPAPRGCAGWSTRSTAPSTSSTACRSTPSPSPPSGTARWSRAWSSTPPPGWSTPRRSARAPPADGRPIAVRGTVPLAERLVFTGFSYDADRRAVQADGAGPAAAAGPRHPAARVLRAGPVPRRRGPGGRLRRGGPSTCGTTRPAA